MLLLREISPSAASRDCSFTQPAGFEGEWYKWLPLRPRTIRYQLAGNRLALGASSLVLL